jgi:hypothetical protein
MHFGRDATRDDPSLTAMRPKSAFGVALGKKFQDGETVPHDPHWVVSAGTFPAGVWRKISALEPACFSLTRSSAKGMPHCFNASHGRKLQDERFLSPITSVYPVAILEASAIVMPVLPCH